MRSRERFFELVPNGSEQTVWTDTKKITVRHDNNFFFSFSEKEELIKSISKLFRILQKCCFFLKILKLKHVCLVLFIHLNVSFVKPG